MSVAIALVAIAAAVSCGANWFSRVRPHRRVETVSKPAATVAIAALAMLVGRDQPKGILISALIGFALCLVGDVALLDAVDSFIVGLGAFLVAHVAFLVMFLQLGLDRPLLGLVGLLLVVVMVVAVGRPLIGSVRTRKPALTGPVVAYLTVISTMVIVGWSTGNLAATIGATAFVASDAVLGWRAFVAEHRWMPVFVMVTYHGALVGLALSLSG